MKKILVFALALMLAIPALAVGSMVVIQLLNHRTGHGGRDGGAGHGDGDGECVCFGQERRGRTGGHECDCSIRDPKAAGSGRGRERHRDHKLHVLSDI